MKPLRKAIEEKGLESPTGPQIQAIPPILEGKNVLLIAPTGTGKTEAAFLPIFSKLLELVGKPLGIKVLYITPLRSLNRDILQRLGWWCDNLDIRVAVRHGDTDIKERSFQSRNPPDVLITTPETLQAILPGRNMRRHLASIRWVVIDEIHKFAEDKRGSQLSLALERLRIITGRDFQVIGLSATIGSPEKVASFLVGKDRPVEIVRVPVARFMEFQIIYPIPSKEDNALAKQLYTYPEVAARLRVMRKIIESHHSVLLFTNTRSIAEILASRFKVWDVDFPISIHHGSLAKSARVTAEIGLKNGGLKGLVCTSSLELGIDVGKIDMCIQYMSPRQVTRLVQRVGRSGHRIGKIAKGIIITSDSDDTLEAMVIARKAYLEDLESVRIPEKPLDALAHEIIGLFMQSRRWGVAQMLEIFLKAYPYRELTETNLLSVLTYMHTRYPRLAWVSFEDKVAMRPKTTKDIFQFYYENLSMIPDNKSYLIVDEEKNTPVGILDEAFVAEYGIPGTKFIVRGSTWKIDSVYKDKIYVKPIDDPTGAIPSWVGEAIPVPFTVAEEVGEIRCFVDENLEQKVEPEDIASKLTEKYPTDKETALKAIQEIIEHFNNGFPIPTNKKIVIEKWEEYLIIHSCFGSLANRTIATLLGHQISEKTGYAVGIQEDPYRIMINAELVNAEMVKDILYELSSMDLNALAIDAFKTTGLFKRRIIHVARRFGAISKLADFGSISLRQLAKNFQGTVIFDEAIKETLDKDANVQGVNKVLQKIRDGRIKLATINTEKPSPIARLGLKKTGKRSLITPEKLQRFTIESAKARLLNEVRSFVCDNCWGFFKMLTIKELEKGLICSNCGSKRIGFSNMSENEIQQLINKQNKGLTTKDKEVIEYIGKTANLMVKYGTLSALVLAGKNILMSDAEEILSQAERVDDKLYIAIVEAENKVLSRRFW